MHRNNFKKFAENPEGMSGCPVEDEQRALEFVSFVKCLAASLATVPLHVQLKR